MNDKEIDKEIESYKKAFYSPMIDELDNLTPEQLNQLLDVLENGVICKSPSRIETNYLERK